jgi:PAN domain
VAAVKFSVSRRAFLVGVGGSLASASLVWSLWRNAGEPTVDVNPVPECCGYTDYGGWVVTTTDKAQLISTAGLTMLDGTMLEGGTLTDRTLPDAESCAAWCVSTSECVGFSYGKPTHPNPDRRGRCWLKKAADLQKAPDSQAVSGLRWSQSGAEP